MSKSKIPYVVCLDPDSGQLYTMSITTHDVHIEKNLPAKIKEKAKLTMKQLTFLKDSFTTKWWFRSHESECFRRRKLPSYLLHQDCLRYPTYEAHSKLSLAFSDIQTIEMEVDISEYQDSIVLLGQEVLEKNRVKKGDRKFSDQLTESRISNDPSVIGGDNQGEVSISDFDEYDPKEIPMIFTINASILTGASEVIKNILSSIFQRYGIRLKPSNELYGFVLKISGFREFLIGESPLLTYDRIREILRGLKTLKVNLTEISQLLISENFPMVVERDSKNIEKGIYDPVDWKKYEDTPLLLWYSPVQLVDVKQNSESTEEPESAYFQKFKRIDVIENDYTQPNFSIKEKIDYSKDNLHKMKSDCIYTAEVDLPLKVRICAVENLQAILTQYDEGATYNGFNTPSYITRQLIKKDEHGAHGKKKKETKKKDGIVITKFGKQKNDEFSGSVQHGDHGSNGQLYNNLYKDGEFTILPYMITVNASLYHGCNLLRKKTIASTKPVPFSFEPRWYEWLKFDNILISELPREIKICFDITIHSPSGDTQVIAATCHQIFDLYNRMSDGVVHLNLWPFYTIEPRFVCQQEFWFLTGKGIPPKESEADIFKSTEYARLVLQFQTFTAPVFWSLRDTAFYPSLKPEIDTIMKKIPSSQDLATVQHLIMRDSLSWNFTEFERNVLIMCRHHYKTIPSALAIFLTAIDWSNPNEVAEAYQMMKIWTPLSPEEAVFLLDARFGDSEVRLYAVDRISNFSDDDLNLYLLELVQALDYEPQHYSALGEFLLERSLANPYKIGHELYWMIRSQLHIKPSYERMSLILEQFLMLCGNFRQELQDEIIVNDMITEIAEEVPRMDKGSRLSKAREKITSLKQHGLPTEFSVSLDTRMRGSELIAEECKVMDSKKLPLWLTVKNSQPGARSIKIIFKTGDDLKQDQLTLQLIRIMDKIWLDNGLDLRMKPYRVLSTADQAGMLEVVLDSETTSDVHKKFGGGALGAFNKKSIMNYIETWNQDQSDLANAKENFIRSCAGYAVATFCLGIGDRHSGNIMLTRSGHLFHIDFGHFLGNFKSKFGIKRERTAFVFTQEMAFVMGGRGSDDFEKFQDLCTKAYNLIRKNGNHFINLFIMMIVSGMPELATYEDIEYLKNQLSMDLTDLEANNKFLDEIQNSLNSTFRRIDNLFHAMKRG